MSTGERGSVLVETLVATAIVTLMVGALFGSLGDAATRSRALEDRRLALLVARSALATGTTGNTTRAGRVAGADGDYVWELTLREAGAGEASTAGRLVRLEALVRRRGDDEVLARLVTLRLLGAS